MSNPAVALHGAHERNGNPIPVFDDAPTFQMACRQLDSVAEATDIEPGVRKVAPELRPALR